MTYEKWKKLPWMIEVDCPHDTRGYCPYPDYIDATSYDDAKRGKRVFIKGLYSGRDYKQTITEQ